jgi:hypothetical protein
VQVVKRPTPDLFASAPVGLRVACLAALFVIGSVRAEKLVTVSSVVEPNYVRRQATASAAQKTETFAFAKGRQVFGTPDASLKKMDFTTLITTLAADLPPPRYAPAEQIETADLVIHVTWGVTKERDDPSALLQFDPDALRQATEAVAQAKDDEEADKTLAMRTLGASAAAEAKLKSEMQMATSLFSDDGVQASSNAELLGFRAAMAGDSDTAETLRTMAVESRYFVILVAYDGPALRGGQKRRLWTTRMSIRAAGVNFPIALNRMSSVAAHFNGLPQPGIVLQDSRDRPAIKPTVGLKVLGDSGK